jgi:lipopolysaccharide export system permease protein
VQFVLIMQFLWKYIDDLVGKGLDYEIIFRLFFFASAAFVPLALPLAVLLSSIMTFGNLGEHFELTAMKASGISLLRFMRSLIIFVVFISAFAFYFSNNLLPKANLEFKVLLSDIRNQKPTLSLEERVFNRDIDGYTIWFWEKGEDGKSLYNLIVYDYSSNAAVENILLAEKGEMYQSDDDSTLVLKLYRGTSYREVPPEQSENEMFEHYKTSFEVWEKRFDLTQFDLRESNQDYYKELSKMLNVKQLQEKIDTFSMQLRKREEGVSGSVSPYYAFRSLGPDEVIQIKPKKDSSNPFLPAVELMAGMEPMKAADVTIRAKNKAIFMRDQIIKPTIDFKKMQVQRLADYQIEFHRRFTLSIACLILFFIGAPLGAITRKGGLGWPLFFSVIFFVVYHVSSMLGEKLAQQQALTPELGMWLSSAILLPIGAFLTIKAKNDSAIYNPETYQRFFKVIKEKLRLSK